jgi:exopolysaccharide production protein ExoQ
VPPPLAALVFFVATIGLFLLDRERDVRTSPAVWLAIVWLALGGSRNVSQWFGAPFVPNSPDDYLEGSPLDRTILIGLLAMGVAVLVARGQRTSDVLRRNAPVMLFFFYCALSVLWSDFPFVAFKRWTKALGNVVMILVVLTDLNPIAALKRFLTWTAFLLIPSSVLLIKYYPALARYYDRWDGKAYYIGVSSDKNMLGGVCLIMGLGMLWRFIDAWSETSDPADRRRRMLVTGSILAMMLWIFQLANSATSFGCFMLGAALIVTLNLFRYQRPAVVHLIVAGIVLAPVCVYFAPDLLEFLVHSMGRNMTFSGRTDLWGDLLRIDTDPLLGTGFESFFLGERLEYLWNKYWWHPNEAHNGFLETYLTLGIVGVCMLAWLIVAGYRNAMRTYRSNPRLGSLAIALLVVAVVYNTTEAAFKVMHPVWIGFLLAVTDVPRFRHAERRRADALRSGAPTDALRPPVWTQVGWAAINEPPR